MPMLYTIYIIESSIPNAFNSKFCSFFVKNIFRDKKNSSSINTPNMKKNKKKDNKWTNNICRLFI